MPRICAAGLTAVTFGLVLVVGFFDPNWVNRSWVGAVQTWTLAAVGLVGVWSSLGRGDWHVRFPLGLLAAGWIAVVHVAAEAAVGGAFTSAELCTQALATYCASAFGGAWLRSLGRWELAGPRPDDAPPRLRHFQFSTATLFCCMLLTAVVLGLWQLVANLEGRVVLRSLFLQVRDFQDAILVATATALAGYAIVFGDRKSAVATTVLLAALLLASGYFTGRFPRGVAVSLGLALAPLVLLRLAGFHRERIERGSDG